MERQSRGQQHLRCPVTAAGTVLDGSGIAVTTAGGPQGFPAVAYDGTNYLVVWSDRRSATSDDIYGTRVDSAGAVLDPSGIAISSATLDQGLPALAFDGTNYLVVWDDDRSPPASDIYGARVSVAGTVLDLSGIAVSTAAGYQFDPAVAFDGTNYLVAWQDIRSDTSSDIYGARISELGVVQETSGIPISTTPGEQDQPAVASNGPFLVAWRERRPGASLDVVASKVNGAGTVQDPGGRPIASSGTDEGGPAITSGPPGNAAFGLAYQRFAPESPFGSNRIFLRTHTK